MNPDRDWAHLNQRYLVERLERIKGWLAAGSNGAPSPEPAQTPPDVNPRAAIQRIADGFRLSPFEQETLLLVAGVELDAGFAAACAEAVRQAGADATRASASPWLICPEHTGALRPRTVPCGDGACSRSGADRGSCGPNCELMSASCTIWRASPNSTPGSPGWLFAQPNPQLG